MGVKEKGCLSRPESLNIALNDFLTLLYLYEHNINSYFISYDVYPTVSSPTGFIEISTQETCHLFTPDSLPCDSTHSIAFH